MSSTIQNSIDFAQTYCQYSPLSVGAGNQPAVGIANEIQYLVTAAPFCWGWNRKEDNSTSTQSGIQDYTIALTDFGFLEKVSLTDPSGAVWPINDIYNTNVLGIADATVPKQGRPNAISIASVTYGTSVKFRFMGCPDQVYLITLTYQKLVSPLTTLSGSTGTWSIPDQYQDIYNFLFLAEALAVVDDNREVLYRRQGIASLLAKAEGLNEMQRNVFLDMYWMRQGRPDLAGPLKAQQSIQGRGV